MEAVANHWSNDGMVTIHRRGLNLIFYRLMFQGVAMLQVLKCTVFESLQLLKVAE